MYHAWIHIIPCGVSVLNQCSPISEVHGNIDTSPCRSNIQSRPKGHEGLAALVGLAHASRVGPSHPRAAVGVCREVQWVRTVARNTHGNTRRCYNKLLSYSNIPIFSMTPERYISLPFIVGGVGGVILLVHHHFSTTMMILPGARKRWRLTVILVVFVKSSSIMIAICNL